MDRCITDMGKTPLILHGCQGGLLGDHIQWIGIEGILDAPQPFNQGTVPHCNPHSQAGQGPVRARELVGSRCAEVGDPGGGAGAGGVGSQDSGTSEPPPYGSSMGEDVPF